MNFILSFSNNLFKFVFCLFVLFYSLIGNSQNVLKGQVKELGKDETIPFSTVQLKRNRSQVITDADGFFKVKSIHRTDTLKVSSLGFRDTLILIDFNKTEQITVNLQPAYLTKELNSITVLPPKELPSTRLFRKIIRNKKNNSVYEFETCSFDQYSTINVAFKTKEAEGNDTIKSTKLIQDGQEYPLCVIETNSKVFIQKSPSILLEEMDGYSAKGIDRVDISEYLTTINKSVNIYQNKYDLFNASLLSPLSDNGLESYRYYIDDTIRVGRLEQYKMRFKPKKASEMAFEGYFLVEDSTFAITEFKADLFTGANINYVQNLNFHQFFKLENTTKWVLEREELDLVLQLTEGENKNKLVLKKQSYKKGYLLNIPTPSYVLKATKNTLISEAAKNRSEQYWQQLRENYLGIESQKVYAQLDSFSQTKLYKKVRFYTYLFGTGHISLGKVDFGDLFDAFSVSYVEGPRVGLSFKTNANFSKQIQISSRVYYGIKDERFKYRGTLKYILPSDQRTVLSFEEYYDLFAMGQSITSQRLGGSLNTLFQTTRPDKLLFVHSQKIQFDRDIYKNAMFSVILSHTNYKPEGKTKFKEFYKDSIQPILKPGELKRLTTTELTLKYRWAKNEEFINGQFERISTGSKFPIITAEATMATKGILGSEYDYLKLKFGYEHRRNLGRLGRVIYRVKAGFIAGVVPFPILEVHEGNQSYYLVRSSFNTMDFFEFVSDRYVSAEIEQHWGGSFFNRFKWNQDAEIRLVTSAKVLYGTISKENRNVFQLPENTRKFGDIPFVEASIGLENIFQVMRIDLFARFTHLPEGQKIPSFTVRARFDLFL
jgi:hypothetical protein